MATETIPGANLSRNITTATTTTVKTGAGTLVRIVQNKFTASSVITVYDNTAASGTILATITSPATLLNNQYVLEYGIGFTTGLTIVTSTADNLTIVYR